MAERRKKLQAEILRSTLDADPRFCRTVVPMSASVERMGVERAPLWIYDRRSSAAQAFHALWREVRGLLGE